MRAGARQVVLSSHENETGDRCVDLFRRPDGGFGFEEFRRDPEDGGAWTRTGHFGDRVYSTLDDAMAAARALVAWFAGGPHESP